VNDAVESFCYLNINNFEPFSEGMFKIDTDYDSIVRNEQDEIIYTKRIQKIPLKSLTFTKNNNIFVSSAIPGIKLDTNLLVDYYDVVSSSAVLSDG